MSDIQSQFPASSTSPSSLPQVVHSGDSPRKIPAAARQSLINLSLGMGIMLAALSGGAYLMMTNKEVLLGGKASVDKQSSFSFAAPTQVKMGEQFTVDVMLDSSADPEYTISGADVVIQYSFTPSSEQPITYPMFMLVKTEQGTIFDSYPTNPLTPSAGEKSPAEPPEYFPSRPIQGTTSISGIKNYSVDDQGYFKGFIGKDVFVRLTFVANIPGKVELKFAYAGATATDDTNINGFLKNVPVNIQKSTERLLTEPTSLQVMVTKPVVILPSPPSSPTPTPKPEPLCNLMDCKPGYECYQPPMPPCKEGSACIQMMPAPYCRPVPTPTSTPRPINQVSWRTSAATLDADDFEISITRNGVVKKYHARSGNVTVHSDMNPLNPTLELSWTENDTPMRLFVYFTNVGSAWRVNEIRTDDGSSTGEWIYYRNFGIKSLYNEIFISPEFSITSSDRGSLQDGAVVSGTIMFKNLRMQNLLSVKPSPTPVPDKPTINVSLSLEGRSNHAIRALVYRVVPGGESLLGQVQTDTNGNGLIQVSDAAIISDPSIRLFVEVPGFLRKYHQNLLRSSATQVTDGFMKPGVLFASFGMLTAGDVHVGATGFGDHQVNSVDVAEMYTQWSTASESENIPTQSGLSGDLNGDGVVNNRDYAIILMNFGKKAGVVK